LEDITAHHDMKVWLVTCAILFITAQFIFWLKQFFLPLPVAIFSGAFLAIASNYEKGIFTVFSSGTSSLTESVTMVSQTASLVEEVPLLEEKK
jgi:hypothetical protein